jgi:hypothetical protein
LRATKSDRSKSGGEEWHRVKAILSKFKTKMASTLCHSAPPLSDRSDWPSMFCTKLTPPPPQFKLRTPYDMGGRLKGIDEGYSTVYDILTFDPTHSMWVWSKIENDVKIHVVCHFDMKFDGDSEKDNHFDIGPPHAEGVSSKRRNDITSVFDMKFNGNFENDSNFDI